jgi:hypothetical protein
MVVVFYLAIFDRDLMLEVNLASFQEANPLVVGFA